MGAPPFGTKNGSAAAGDIGNALFIAVHTLLYSVFCTLAGGEPVALREIAAPEVGRIVMMRWFPHPRRGLAGIVGLLACG